MVGRGWVIARDPEAVGLVALSALPRSQRVDASTMRRSVVAASLEQLATYLLSEVRCDAPEPFVAVMVDRSVAGFDQHGAVAQDQVVDGLAATSDDHGGGRRPVSGARVWTLGSVLTGHLRDSAG